MRARVAVVAIVSFFVVLAGFALEGVQCVPYTPPVDANGHPYWDLERKSRAHGAPLPLLTTKEIDRWSPPASQRLRSLYLADRYSLQRDEYDRSRNYYPAYYPVYYPPDAYEVAFNASGKLYFSGTDNEDSWCSGFFVDANVIMTAAHCIFDNVKQQYSAGLHFARGEGTSRGEDYPIVKAAFYDEWRTSDYPGMFDYAFLLTSTRLPQDVTPLAITELTKETDWMTVGYPQTYDAGGVDLSGGGSMLYVIGSLAYRSEMILMNGNSMKKGSSGGPWVPNSYVGGPYGTTVISVSSKMGWLSGTMWGPLLDSRTLALRDYLKGECVDSH